ncbi:MAG: SRPBCC family protein [Terracoccus sp.]
MSADELTYSESAVVAATPQQVYDLVSDVTRTGEWSPICRECWWDEGDGPRVGAWFTGRNEVPGRTWQTRSQVVVADPGERFAFVVGGSLVRWSYTLAPVDGGTELTESWQFLPEGLAMFAEKYGDDAPAQIEDRTRAAHAGIPATLAAIAAIAASGQLAT